MKYQDIPILMYHDISDADNPWSVSPAEFRKQMQFLKNKGYRTINLEELKEGLANRRKVDNKQADNKQVVITFDDARKGVFTHALPMLQECGFTATVYVVPSWLDGGPIPQHEAYSDFMMWKDLSSLTQAGWEIGSHTFSHKNLTKLDGQQVQFELEKSKQVIQQKLGKPPLHFSFPYGAVSRRTLELVQSHYSTAVTIKKGMGKTGAFSRQWVLGDTTFNQFEKLLTLPTLSLCMIVKNEQQHLERCLQSVQGLVDEIIIVDTGSTDTTKEIAAKFTDRLFDFTWCDDFAAARNESLKHATGDWILVLDADEILEGQDYDAIQGALHNWDVAGFNIVTKNYNNNSSIMGWRAGPDPLNQGLQGWFPSVKVRLFQNQGSQFKGKVHELVDHGSLQKFGKVLALNVFVHHYGSAESSKSTTRVNNSGGNISERNKSQRNLALTKQKISHNPRDAKAYFELGIQYKQLGDLEQAEQSLEHSLLHDPSRVTPLLNLAIVQQKQGKIDIALSNFKEALKKDHANSEAHFGAGFCFFRKGNLTQAQDHFEKAVQQNPGFVDAYINLGAICEKLEQFSKATAYLKQALLIHPPNARACHNLGVVYEKQMNVGAALQYYEKAIQLGYHRKEQLQQRVEKIRAFLAENASVRTSSKK